MTGFEEKRQHMDSMEEGQEPVFPTVNPLRDRQQLCPHSSWTCSVTKFQPPCIGLSSLGVSCSLTPSCSGSSSFLCLSCSSFLTLPGQLHFSLKVWLKCNFSHLSVFQISLADKKDFEGRDFDLTAFGNSHRS